MDDRSGNPGDGEINSPDSPHEALPGSTNAESPAPPPAPVVAWNSGAQWEEIDAAAAAGTTRHPLKVGAAIGRTLDLFVRQPRVFVILALPAAIVGTAAGYMTASATTVAFVLVATFVSAIVNLALGLATIIAADEVRAGRQVELGSVIGRAVAAAAVAFVSGLAQNAVIFGLIFVGAILFVAIPGGSSPVGVVLIAAIVGYVALRWSMAGPAIALEEVGPIRALARSRFLTKGSLWKIAAVFLGLALLAAPIAIGAVLIAFVVGGWPGAILGGLATILFSPLFGIGSATVLGDLTARPESSPVPAPSRRNRTGFAVALVVIGIVAVGVALPRVDAAAGRFALVGVPEADRGVILAGTSRANDLCHPLGAKATFTTAETIYIGGYFTRGVPSGRVAKVDVFVDGVLVNSGQVGDPTRMTNCYAERGPLVGGAPGTYRLVVSYAGDVIAEGTFAIR